MRINLLFCTLVVYLIKFVFNVFIFLSSALFYTDV